MEVPGCKGEQHVLNLEVLPCGLMNQHLELKLIIVAGDGGPGGLAASGGFAVCTGSIVCSDSSVVGCMSPPEMLDLKVLGRLMRVVQRWLGSSNKEKKPKAILTESQF